MLLLLWILQKEIFVPDDFSKSCCKRLRAFILAVGGMRIFARGSGGLCLYVNEEGFAKKLHSLA